MILDMDTLYRIYSNEHDRYWPLRHTSTGTGQPPSPPSQTRRRRSISRDGAGKKKGDSRPFLFYAPDIYLCGIGTTGGARAMLFAMGRWRYIYTALVCIGRQAAHLPVFIRGDSGMAPGLLVANRMQRRSVHG